MLIVVEGCDGVGKSSLVKQLVERIDGDLTVRHLGPPKRHPLEETVLSLNDYLPGTGMHAVCDRFHLGELIYGPIYRGESQLGPIDGPGHRWVDGWIRSVGGYLVLVNADLETVTARIGVRGDDFVQTEHLDRILTEYRKTFFHSHAARALVYVPGVHAETVIRDARTAEANAARSPLHVAGLKFVGNPHPKIMLVGDEPSPRHARGDRPTFRAPFVPYRDGCGWYLMETLTTRLVDRCAVVNQVDLTEDHVGCFAGTEAVALGQKAHRTLERLHIAHGTVPHPQWIRRFHHGRLAEYGTCIEKVRIGEDVTDYFKALVTA